MSTITLAQIEALSTEAAAHGDLAQVAICDRALAGDESAMAECERVIRDAQAQDDSDEAEVDVLSAAADALEAAGYDADERSPEPGLYFYLLRMAPDSDGASTEPGSAWDKECDAILAGVRAVLEGLNVRVEWSDNDIIIEVADPS